MPWSKDGYLILNGGGLLYRIYIKEQKKELFDTSFATTYNNGHGISPDGKQIAFVRYKKE